MTIQIVWALLVILATLAAGLAVTSRRNDLGAACLLAAVLATAGLTWLLRLDFAVLLGLGPAAVLAWFVGHEVKRPRAPVRPLVTLGLASPVIVLAALLVLTVQQVDWRMLPPARRDLAVTLEVAARLASSDRVLLMGMVLLLGLGLVFAAWSACGSANRSAGRLSAGRSSRVEEDV